MTVNFNIAMSDELNAEIDKVVEQPEKTKSEVLRKAISLYLAAHRGKAEGLAIGLVDRDTNQMRTEIVGL